MYQLSISIQLIQVFMRLPTEARNFKLILQGILRQDIQN